MRILLVNDDGIEADGIRALIDALHEDHELIVVAPDGERSGFSQSMTYKDLQDITKYSIKGYPDILAYHTTGTPADCAKVGIKLICKDKKPELVISGINYGYNIGTDILYSGTVGAATEAVMDGCRAIAVSQYYTQKIDYTYAAEFTRGFIESIDRYPMPAGTFININFPDIMTAPAKGIRVVPQGYIDYQEYYHLEKKISETAGTYRIWGRGFRDAGVAEDAAYIKQGYITITPIKINRTDEKSMAILEDLNQDFA